MSGRTMVFVTSLLCFAVIGFAEEPRLYPAPQAIPSPPLKPDERARTALDQIQKAADELQSLGYADEAKVLRSTSEQIRQKATAELNEVTHKIAELQKKAAQLQKLSGASGSVLIQCRFVELSGKSAVEWTKIDAKGSNQSGPAISVHKNGDELIERLRSAGEVKVLAEPSIITALEERAKVMSGGEFPVPIPGEGGKVSMEWRQFGMRCQVVPHLIDGRRVRLDFAPEISTLDYNSAVVLAGYKVPGLIVRGVNTQYEMNFGETLVVSLESTAAGSDKPDAIAPKTITLFMATPTRALQSAD